MKNTFTVIYCVYSHHAFTSPAYKMNCLSVSTSVLSYMIQNNVDSIGSHLGYFSFLSVLSFKKKLFICLCWVLVASCRITAGAHGLL